MARKKNIKTFEKTIQKTEDRVENLRQRLKEEQDKLRAQEESLKVERYERILAKFWEIEIDDEDQIEQIIDQLVNDLKKDDLIENATDIEDEGGFYNENI